MNKKAFEQYNSFTTQRDSLTKRRKELDDSQASIQELVEVLDQRKDEAIERTFKQVSKEFASIFERLVPAGRGRLVIQRKTDQRAREDEESDEEPRETVENYTGVGISVSFNSKHDEQQRIQQLSGGQKSMSSCSAFMSRSCVFHLLTEVKVFVHWLSSLLSNNATLRLSIFSMKSMRILTLNTVLQSPKCWKKFQINKTARTMQKWVE